MTLTQEERDGLREQWEEGKKWFRFAMAAPDRQFDLVLFKESLCKDDSKEALNHLAKSEFWADITTRLANLALAELALRIADESL
jgi:hypothetical protein